MVNKERVGALIEKLQEQFLQNAPAHYLLITAHQLQASLLEQSFDVSQANHPIEINIKQTETPPKKAPEVAPQVKEPELKINFELEEPKNFNEPIKILNTPLPESIVEKVQQPEKKPVLSNIENATNNNKEINDILANNNKSLNDVLQNETLEIGQIIDETPIPDLRKAFSINERFLITQSLFRNDDLMYERSLKTLNGFNNYSEALQWMEREFIVNLAWDKNNEMVKDFYNIVKRRFS